MSDYKEELQKKAQVILNYHKNKMSDVVVAYIADSRFTNQRKGTECDIRMDFTIEIITKTNKYVCKEVVTDNPYIVSTIKSVSEKEPNVALRG